MKTNGIGSSALLELIIQAQKLLGLKLGFFDLRTTWPEPTAQTCQEFSWLSWLTTLNERHSEQEINNDEINTVLHIYILYKYKIIWPWFFGWKVKVIKEAIEWHKLNDSSLV